MNTLKELLTTEDLVLYEKTEYPFNLSILHNALKQKLEEDPDYEVWVPLIYYKLESHVKSVKSELVIKPYKILISNKGNVCSLRCNKIKQLTTSFNDRGYPTVFIGHGNKIEGLIIHRIIGCSFISLPDHLATRHPKDLQVNHINGTKIDITLTNLEWSTPSENMAHSVKTGLLGSGETSRLTKPVKGMVLKGEFAGYEFILYGLKDYQTYGFTQPLIAACVNGRVKSHRSCSWSRATPEEIATLPKGLTPEVKLSL